jgi:dihydroorotase
MDIIIRAAKLIEPNNPLHEQMVDVGVSGGKIKEIGKNLTKGKAKEIHSENLHICAGWMDILPNFCDPGNEHKEDLKSGVNAAAAGGFTAVALSPSTLPAVDNKSMVEYIINATEKSIVKVYPSGTVSTQKKGEDLAELFDMHLSGARVFTDDLSAIQNPDLLKRALLYGSSFGALIMNFPNDKNISASGKINESANTANLGIKTMPALAEEIMLARDLFIAEYTNCKLHIHAISTKKSVELVREAKKKGIKVTADVAIANLVWTDNLLQDFDSNYKLMPPLRTASDLKALHKGLADGTIDAICTNHRPENEENKKCEFDFAAFGCTNLETAFSLLNENIFKEGDFNLLYNKLVAGPRKILGMSIPEIKVGNTAEISLFDPSKTWTYNESNLQSKSRNNARFNSNLTGKVIGIINGTNLFLNN